MRNLCTYLFLAIVFFAVFPSRIYGQKLDLSLDLPEGLKVGTKAGFVGAKIVGGVDSYFAPRLLLGVWGLYPSPFLEEMDFKAEMLVSGSGGRDATRRNQKGRWSYTYISFPLLASFTPFETEKLRFDAGLQPNFLFRARYRDQNEVFNITQETRTLDMSLVLGGGFQLKEEWFVDWRIVLATYNHSLRDWTDDRYLNQSVQLAVGKWLLGE